MRVIVPRGSDPPYAIDDNKIYVRSESETGLAVRDEIVNLIQQKLAPPLEKVEMPGGHIDPPRTGVEIVATEDRQGVLNHTMRDLRNGNVVKNVTRRSARRLWHYAITQAEDHPVSAEQLEWEGEIALIRKREWAGQARYDLAQRDNGRLRIYYGVTDDGVHGPWARLVGIEGAE